MGLTIDLATARSACTTSIKRFVGAVASLSEHDLLGASRCHGWTRLDVVVHVLGGWHEMFSGLVSRVRTAPTVDAASYWTAFADDYATDDPVDVLMAQRRRTAAFARPAAATPQLDDVGEAIQRGIDSFDAEACLWQGHVFAPGDFLAVWAVEHAVHHLDLRSDVPPAGSSLRLARATMEALVGEPLPTSWSDEEATLIGSGRAPVPADAGPIANRLPALG